MQWTHSYAEPYFVMQQIWWQEGGAYPVLVCLQQLCPLQARLLRLHPHLVGQHIMEYGTDCPKVMSTNVKVNITIISCLTKHDLWAGKVLVELEAAWPVIPRTYSSKRTSATAAAFSVALTRMHCLLQLSCTTTIVSRLHGLILVRAHPWTTQQPYGDHCDELGWLYAL